AHPAVTTSCTTRRRRRRAGYLTLPPHPYPGHPIPSTPGEAMDPAARIDAHDRILRGDGNGTPGLVARTSSLERRADSHSQRLDELEGDVEAQERRWQSFLDQMKGFRYALIVFGVLATFLGGGLGVAILNVLGKVSAALP